MDYEKKPMSKHIVKKMVRPSRVMYGITFVAISTLSILAGLIAIGVSRVKSAKMEKGADTQYTVTAREGDGAAVLAGDQLILATTPEVAANAQKFA
ncbi:hypothetical protein BC830DRAFT_1225913 [Chytriomyces sp. MP71]|nr:hypothetical protein BC830DRAFT_1225913 [Chytriomyces sp. MP71]